jgi:GT2 family glycosyltransferase
MKPSLCVVNYNGLRYLRETLAAAVRNASELTEIIVFDNASTDGSAELAEKEFPAVKVVRLGENRGPGPARNAALDRAVSDRVLIVDNDVRLTEHCAELMSAALDLEPNAAVCMPRTRTSRSRCCPWRCAKLARSSLRLSWWTDRDCRRT